MIRHELSICSKKEFDDWKAGKLFYDESDDTFLSKEYVESEYDNEDDRIHEMIYSYDEYERSNYEFELFEQRYTSESGDEIIAFGYYGNE